MGEITNSLQGIAFFTLLLAIIPASAEAQPKPQADTQAYYVCPGLHGLPMLLTEEQLAEEKLKNSIPRKYCRKEHSWQPAQRWLCKIGDAVLLSDYPIKKVGILSIPELAEIGLVEQISCLEISKKCPGSYHLISEKFCYNQIKSGKNYWEQFAKQGNTRPQTLLESCPETANGQIIFPAQSVNTHCTRESCVLRNYRSTWSDVIELLDPETEIESINDLEFLTNLSLSADSTTSEALLKQAGVYCIEHREENLTKGPDAASQKIIEQAKLALALPRTWPRLSRFPNNRPEQIPSAIDPFRCQSDTDCVQGKGPGQCMIKSMATSETTGNDPSYQCVCLKGPVVFGCVAQQSSHPEPN